MRTASLRRRVTWLALLVLVVVLPVTGLVVKQVFDAQAERNLDALLTGRTQLAQQLARQNVAPAALVRRIDADGVRVTLVLRSGQVLGAPPVEASSGVRQVRATLQAGQRTKEAELTVAADTSLLAEASGTLRRTLLISGAAALVITVLALVVGMRFALAPLDAMTGLARSIAAGRRGGRLQPTRDDTELGRTAAAFDEMLDALEGAEQQARESEARMREFVADAAHELRTPVAGIRTAAETLLRLGPDASPRRRDEVELLLVRESQRAGALVDDLLDLARIDAGLELRLGPVWLNLAAKAQAQRLRLVAPELTVEVLGHDIELQADSDRVTQILTNLTNNARAAAGDRGTIQILIHMVPGDGERRGGMVPGDGEGRGGMVPGDGERRGGMVSGDGGGRGGAGAVPAYAEVVVQDNGPGVLPVDRERIFRRLVHSPATRGSGLGLPIARGFARAHGGDLTCGDRPDGLPGAAFRLLLPFG
ncbi:histidine kinase dimerization/phospho-acceptor domain-containing protein [Kribbella sp. DT2]|uniref:HAMP domain-containing sensor histidine kinase n=1 Tax=Kribbella sp. DT2 TaxID=3393427 RepID=UPI003CF3A60C